MNDVDSEVVQKRAEALLNNASADSEFVVALEELQKCYISGDRCTIKTGSVDFLEVQAGLFCFQIRIEDLNGNRKEVDSSYKEEFIDVLRGLYTSVVAGYEKEKSSALNLVSKKYCKNFNLCVGLSMPNYRFECNANNAINALVKATLAMCVINKEDSTTIDDSIKTLDEIRDSFKVKGLTVKADSCSFKIYDQDLFIYSVQVFDSKYRNGESLGSSNIMMLDKIRTVIYDAYQLNTTYIGKDIANIVNVYPVKATLTRSSNYISFSQLREIKKYIKEIAMFTINWLAGEDFSDYDSNVENSNDCFIYCDAINRTMELGDISNVEGAVRLAASKVPDIKFTKLDIGDLISDISVVLKPLIGVKGHIAELVVYDMMNAYLDKGQIDVMVNVYGLNAINAQKHVLRTFARILICNIA